MKDVRYREFKVLALDHKLVSGEKDCPSDSFMEVRKVMYQEETLPRGQSPGHLR